MTRDRSMLRAGSAAMFAFALAACAPDSTVGTVLIPDGVSFAAAGDAANNTPTLELLKVCKVWVNAPVADINATLNGAQAGDITSPFNVPAATGTGAETCRVVAVRGPNSPGDFSVTEDDPGLNFTTTWTINSTDDAQDAAGAGLTSGTTTIGGVTTNNAGAVITFTNTLVEAGCTFTKGYYRNHPDAVSDLITDLGGSITVGGQSLDDAQAQAILDATPGKPGAITFTSNNLLNLTQQLITAILNGGESGPSSVQTAIADANAGISIAGDKTSITTTLSNTEVSALIGALAGFNEGALDGFPHCDD
ncbi:MAG TPA: hypothetical protein VF981_14580 [Gemmatimonadaceae bacterium]